MSGREVRERLKAMDRDLRTVNMSEVGLATLARWSQTIDDALAALASATPSEDVPAGGPEYALLHRLEAWVSQNHAWSGDKDRLFFPLHPKDYDALANLVRGWLSDARYGLATPVVPGLRERLLRDAGQRIYGAALPDSVAHWFGAQEDDGKHSSTVTQRVIVDRRRLDELEDAAREAAALLASTPVPDGRDSGWWEPWREKLAEDRTGQATTIGAAALLRDEGYSMQADLLLACLDHSYAAQESEADDA